MTVSRVEVESIAKMGWDKAEEVKKLFHPLNLDQKRKVLKMKLKFTINRHYNRSLEEADALATHMVRYIQANDFDNFSGKCLVVINAYITAKDKQFPETKHNLLTLIQNADTAMKDLKTETLIEQEQKDKQGRTNYVLIYKKEEEKPSEWGAKNKGAEKAGGSNDQRDGDGNNQRGGDRTQSMQQLQREANDEGLIKRLAKIEREVREEKKEMSDIQKRTKKTEKNVAHIQTREYFDKISTEWEQKYQTEKENTKDKTEEEKNKICTIESVKAFVDQFFAHKGYLDKYTQMLIKAKFYPWLETNYPPCIWKIYLTQEQYKKLAEQRQNYSDLFNPKNMQTIKDKDGNLKKNKNGELLKTVIWQPKYNKFFEPPESFGGEQTQIDPDRANVAWKRYVTRSKLLLPQETNGYLMAATPNPFILDLAL